MRFSACVIFMLMCGVTQAEWVEYASTETGPAYFDDKRVEKIKDAIFIGWEKYVSPQEVVDKMQAMDTNFNNYAFTVTKNYIDCKRSLITPSATYAFSKTGTQMFSYQYPEREMQWVNIVPGTTVEMLMKAICK